MFKDQTSSGVQGNIRADNWNARVQLEVQFGQLRLLLNRTLVCEASPTKANRRKSNARAQFHQVEDMVNTQRFVGKDSATGIKHQVNHSTTRQKGRSQN